MHEAGDTTIVEAAVTYARHDDAQVTVPVASVYRTSDRGVEEYRIYGDLTPVFS